MMYSLTDIFLTIENYPLSTEWSFFSVEQIDSLKEKIIVKKQEKGDIILFTANGFENSSLSFSRTANASVGEQYLYRFCANVLLSKGAIHLHSSFALFKGKGLIFTGPSGIGKTTQAELWRDFQGALIVNGDACLLRQMDNDWWWAFGTPIHGSSPYCENEKAPIAAIITLEQGEENVLTRMDDFSALSYCLPEFYRPKMNEKTEETFWNSVDSLFRSVPIYHLVCRPDREATEIVKKEIFDV